MFGLPVMSKELFTLAMAKINAAGQGSIVLRDNGKSRDVKKLRVAPKLPGIAVATLVGQGYYYYFAINDLLAFEALETEEPEDEQTQD
jgi:hypothetical protein